MDLLLATAETRGRSPKTIDGYKRFVEKYLAGWLNRPLAEITPEDVHKKHRKIAVDVATGRYAKVELANGTTYRKRRSEGDGKVTANATMRGFRAAYNRALRQHRNLPSNPCSNIDWFIERPRKTTIADTDMPAFYQAVQALENPIHRDYLLLVLFTGLRKTSAAEIRWEHVDWDRRALHIPKPKGGEKRAFDLPLSDFLVDLLRRRQAEHKKYYPKSDFVFPSNGSKTGHIRDVRMTLNGQPMRLHDLRRKFIRVAESLNVSPYAVKLLCNHALPSSDITASYLDAELDRLHEVIQQVTDRLKTLCEIPSSGNVASIATAWTVGNSARA
ncbi:MAG: tyrosine-type recombinase/integrase [Gammaproteobacteria bacterium]